VPEQFCAIEGVRKLPAGSWARLTPDGREHVEHYWVVADVARDAEASRGPSGGPSGGQSAAPDLGRVIEESVAAHLVADVPVSSFLSGGLDSSIITVLAHRAAQEIDAYTITFRPEDQRLEAMPDDAIYARKVAARFGVKLHEIELSPDIVDMLPRMVDALDEPIGDAAAINTVLMCQAARERGVKVILSGMGADELFGGYRKQMACLMASRYSRLPGPVRAGARFAVDRTPVALGGRGLRYARWAKRFLTFAELPEEPRFRRSYTLYDPDDLASLLSPGLRGQVDRVIDSHREIYTDNSLHDEVNRMCLADSRLFLPGLNLAYTDRASMSTSVEVRVPFVDPVVAQAAFAIPGRDKIRNRQGKLALKQAAEQWLPREIIYRPKASFGAPLRGWIRNDLRDVINDVLVRGELVGSGMIQAGPLDRLIADERAGRQDNSKQIWQLLTMELWHRNMRSMGVAA
jgi:asparagine synthase (glutamine-hydrolysing)